MAKAQPGMGRGLTAILALSPDAERSAPSLRELPLELIVPNPQQPRRAFDPDAIAALAASLAERGVLQPVLVRPLVDGRYELIAGERRWRAASVAGLERIPAVVREDDDASTLELALVENMVREDLNPIEQARACAALVEDLGLTREEVGARVGKSRVAVSNLIRLLDLPDEAIGLIARGELSEGHGRALLLAADHGRRRELAQIASERSLSVRALEELARERRALSTSPPTADADHAEAARAVEDRLTAILGTEVRVRPRGKNGFRAEVQLSSLEQANELIARLASRAGISQLS